MTDADRRKLAGYLARPEADLLAELALYDASSKGVGDAWARIAGPLRQRVCEEWGWCQVRQDARFENDLDLAAAVLAALTVRVLHLPVPADLALVAAILVKRGLDAFCGCV
jgi:hypothetical protein